MPETVRVLRRSRGLCRSLVESVFGRDPARGHPKEQGSPNFGQLGRRAISTITLASARAGYCEALKLGYT